MGGEDGGLRHDQALERWAAMRENVHIYWRPRASNILPLFVLVVGVPTVLYYGICWGFVPVLVLIQV